jgi:hypothetical protein
MQDLPLQGSLADIFLPRVIAWLHRQGFEGTVRVSTGAVTKVLYFRAGDLASAASNDEADRLANILIRDDRLTQEQLEMAKGRVSPGGSLGKTLIELGFLTPTELLHGARRQVREILASTFALPEGTYQVETGPLPAEVTSLGLPTRRLIFDCLVEASDRAWIVREIGSMESLYAPTEDLTILLSGLRLEPEMDRLARLIDGTSSLRDLSGRTSLDDFTVSKMVLALDVLGMAERAELPAPAPARAGGRSIPIAAGEPLPPADRFAATGPPPAPVPAEPETVEEETLTILDEAQEVDAHGKGADAHAQGGDEGAGEPIEIDGDESLADAAIMVEPPGAPAPAAAHRRAPVPPEAEEGIAISIDDDGGAGEEPTAPTIGLTPPEPAEPEPPAISGDELPAFARPATEPEWQLDPDTGERVHIGPIEVEFQGRVAGEAPARGGRTRLLLVAASLVLVVGAVAAIFMARRGGMVTAMNDPTGDAAAPTRSGPAPESPAPDSPPPAAPPPPAPAGAVSSSPEPASGTEGPAPPVAGPDTGAPLGAPPTGEPPAADPPAAQPSPAKPPVAEPSAVEPPVARPRETTPIPPPPRGSVSPFAEGRRYLAALRTLDSGQIPRAATLFQELADAEAPERATLQLMIACQEETVRRARAAGGDRGSLFVLPYDLKGRACYRVCWGGYASRADAESAAPGLPDGLLAPGSRPVVVPLARLRGDR